MTTIQPCARCPRCQQSSTRIHSRYARMVADLPWLEVAVRVELHTRRFFCRQPACAQQIFCERLPAIAAPYARRPQRLAPALQAFGFALVIDTISEPLRRWGRKVGMLGVGAIGEDGRKVLGSLSTTKRENEES